MVKLMNWQSDRQTFWNDHVIQKFTLPHNVQHQYVQSKEWIFCVLLVMGTCNVLHNTISRICRNIQRHFNCFVDPWFALFSVLCGSWPHCEEWPSVARQVQPAQVHDPRLHHHRPGQEGRMAAQSDFYLDDR